MPDNPRPYHAFLLRVWCEPSVTPPGWRASVEAVAGQERVGFADLDALCDFLRHLAPLEATPPTSSHPRSSPCAD